MLDLILSELGKSRETFEAGLQVIPRLRIITEAGEFVAFMPPPTDLDARRRQYGLAARVMAWRRADAFLFSLEMTEPQR